MSKPTPAVAFLCLAFLSSLTLADSEPSPSEIAAQKLADAVPIELYSPHFTIHGGYESRLIVLNTAPYEVSFDVAAISRSGEVLPLTSRSLSNQRHLELDLADLIASTDTLITSGGLRVAFVGDEETLQAWLVLRRGRNLQEISLTSAADVSASPTSFWDSARTVVFHLMNTGPAPLRYSIEGSRDFGDGELDSLSSVAVKITDPRGWARFVHDGLPGSLRVTGIGHHGRSFSELPLFSEAALGSPSEYESVRFPKSSAGIEATVLMFHNASEEDRDVAVSLVDSGTGQVVGQHSMGLNSRAVRRLPLARLSRPGLDQASPLGFRVSVQSPNPGVLVDGRSHLGQGQTTSLAFFARQDAHAGGSYPIPSLESNEVVTTIVNLSDEASTIVAHFAWDGGDYAWGPVDVPAGSTLALDISEIAAAGTPDVLGRTLEPEFSQGFLRWRVHSGSRELIGRTDVRPRDGDETFGFSCWGCCYEVPEVEIEPPAVHIPTRPDAAVSILRHDAYLHGNRRPLATHADKHYRSGTLLLEQHPSWCLGPRQGNTVL